MQAGNVGYVVPVGVDVSKVDTAGAIVWWRLSGDVDYEALAENWFTKALGFEGFKKEDLPLPPTYEQSLRRALREQEEKRVLVRPLDKKGKWAIVRESATAGKLDYQTLFVVGVNKIGDLEFDAQGYGGLTPVLHDEISGSYELHKGRLSPSDVSSWLVDLAYHMKAVSLRDTGGIYFMPNPTLRKWKIVVDVLRSCSSHALFEVPALKSSEAVDAILDAVTIEAKAEIESLEKALNEADERTSRGLSTRANRAAAMQTKLQEYEELLGKKAKDVGEKLEQLKLGLTEAALSAESGSA